MSQGLNKVREPTMRLSGRKAFLAEETINKMALTWQNATLEKQQPNVQ